MSKTLFTLKDKHGETETILCDGHAKLMPALSPGEVTAVPADDDIPCEQCERGERLRKAYGLE